MTEHPNKSSFHPSASTLSRIPAPWLAGFSLVVRLGLAAVFILAGVLKLKDPGAFAQAIGQYDLVPEGIIPLLALGLPVVELLAGVGLLFDLKGSLAVIAGLLLLFTIVLGYAILNDLDIDCGCFTLEELQMKTTVREAFYRDLVLLAGIAFLYWRRRIRDACLHKG